jgi:hypothetical protein
MDQMDCFLARRDLGEVWCTDLRACRREERRKWGRVSLNGLPQWGLVRGSLILGWEKEGRG